MTAEYQRAYKERHSERIKQSRATWKAENKHTPRVKYDNHKSRARQRGIEWGFTFETWWAMWEPYFENMGQTSSSFHMCRTGDTGPYSPDNCRIDTAEVNGREGAHKRYTSRGGEK